MFAQAAVTFVIVLVFFLIFLMLWCWVVKPFIVWLDVLLVSPDEESGLRSKKQVLEYQRNKLTYMTEEVAVTRELRQLDDQIAAVERKLAKIESRNK